MDKRSKEIVAAVLLSCVLIFLLWNNARSSRPAGENASAAVLNSGSLDVRPAAPTEAVLNERKLRKERIEALKGIPWNANPFRAGGSDTLPVHLEGILWDPAKPMVMINGDAYETGATVAGHKVMLIEKDSVTLEGPSGRIRIPLNGEI